MIKNSVILSSVVAIMFSMHVSALSAYSNESFHHDENIATIDELVLEGKALLNQLYNGEDLLHPTLNLQDSWVAKAKYSWLREKFSPSGVYRSGLNWLFNKDQFNKDRLDYLTQIIVMMWGVFGESVDKDQGFVRGSYKIIDPDYKLYNFLLGYVRLVTGAESPNELPFGLTSSNFGYRRSPRIKGSSHYKNECQNDEQFGIDIRRKDTETLLKVLPASKAHLLFGRLVIPGSDLPIIFIKFEEVGLGGLGEFIDHSINWGNSGNNLTTADRREKDINAGVKAAFKLVCERLAGDDRKESDEPNVFVETARKIKVVRDMAAFLNKHSLVPNFSETIQDFQSALETSGYEPDYLHIRNGNEVILDHHHWKK